MDKVGDALREKIVIVQDSPLNLTATLELVSRSGYATSRVLETPHAVEKVGQENPDLIIIDLGIPSPKGQELLSQLKSERGTQHIPIFVVGTPEQTTDRAQWFTIGAADYLDYPFHPEVLNARLHAILRRYVPMNPVTHIPSGTYLQRQVDAWLAKNELTAVLYLDIDHFASYNSAYGHEAGNRVLQFLAKLIVDVLPVGPFSVAHMGGDDFMVAFPPNGAVTFVETIVKQFRAAQKDFYNETDFARGYIQEHDPSLPPRNWPLITLSAALVTNEHRALTGYLHASSLLCRAMTAIKAEKEAREQVSGQSSVQNIAPSSARREGRGRFYRRICHELSRGEAREFEAVASTVASHFAEVGDHERAALFFGIAGDWSQRNFAPVEARSQYENALASLAHLPDDRQYLRRRVESGTGYAMAKYGSSPPSQTVARLTAVESLAGGLEARGQKNPGDRVALTRLELAMGHVLSSTNKPREGLDYCRQVEYESKGRKDDETAAAASGEIGLGYARQGYCGQAVSLLRAGIAQSERSGDWQQWVYFVAHLAMSLVARGDVAAGLEHAEAIKRRAKELKSNIAMIVCEIFLSFIYMLAGDADGSVEASRECVALVVETEELLLANLSYGFRAWGECLTGDLVAAQEALRRQEETASRLGGESALADHMAAIAAEVFLRLGSTSKAMAQARHAVELARQTNGILAEGLAERVWAMAIAAGSPMRYNEAERHLISSVSAFELGECRVEAARTRVIWGLVAASNGRLGSATRQLESAAVLFETAGLVRELEETRQILLALEPSTVV